MYYLFLYILIEYIGSSILEYTYPLLRQKSSSPSRLLRYSIIIIVYKHTWCYFNKVLIISISFFHRNHCYNMHGKNIYFFFHLGNRYPHKRSAGISGFRFSISLVEKRLIKYIYIIFYYFRTLRPIYLIILPYIFVRVRLWIV